MSYYNNMPPEAPRTQAFIDSYDPGDDVVVGRPPGFRTTLGQALEFEELSCTVSDEIRLDPDRRIRFLAGILHAAGSLRPQDEHYLGEGR